MSFSQLILWFPEAKENPEINVSLQSSTAALSSFFNAQKCCRDSSYKHMHSVVLSSLPLSHSLIFFLNLFLVLAFIFCFGLVLEGFEFVFFFITTHYFFFPSRFQTISFRWWQQIQIYCFSQGNGNLYWVRIWPSASTSSYILVFSNKYHLTSIEIHSKFHFKISNKKYKHPLRSI